MFQFGLNLKINFSLNGQISRIIKHVLVNFY